MGNERAVVLWDLENVIGVNPGPDLLASRLTAVRAFAEPIAVCWAAYPATLPSEPSRKVLKAHGVKTRLAKTGKNSADKALLDLAREEAAKGHRRFVVVSADADFAAVADLGTLEVVVRQNQKISQRLQRRATRVHRLPGTAGQTPRARVTLAVPRQARTMAAGPVDRVQHPAALEAAGPPSGNGGVRRSAVIHAAMAGLGVWAAGVCFGAGVSVGAVLVRRLTHRHAQVSR
ncbi:NYN domain-containing protein [Nonomuraea insulae]|uniref:NYN domain-containing protein n=1 Tax=Nonomuraea insulae TaxID=1616787 RepID=A0ABW1CQP9_9ACTN